jgi:hypothetical protein
MPHQQALMAPLVSCIEDAVGIRVVGRDRAAGIRQQIAAEIGSARAVVVVWTPVSVLTLGR